MSRASDVGSFTPHPLGIIRMRPEAHRLVLHLFDEPHIIRHWAESLLPSQHGDADDDPRDQVWGVRGLRYRQSSSGIVLYRPDSDAQIVLTGFNRHWWDRIASRLETDYDVLFTRPQWTNTERAAETLVQASGFEAPELLSPLLRRIRATAGPGPLNNTVIWHSGCGFRMETTYGPHCTDLISYLCEGPTSLGWRVEWQWCYCASVERTTGCTITFHTPGCGSIVEYSNLRWHHPTRRARKAHRLAELNARAFEDC